jgi:hypothetical protein
MNHWIASSEEKVGIRTEIQQSSPLQPQSFQKHRHPSSPNAITIITLLTRLEVGRWEIFEQGARKGRAKGTTREAFCRGGHMFGLFATNAEPEGN